MKVTIRNLGAEPFSTDFLDSQGEDIRRLVPPGATVVIADVDPFYLNQDKILRRVVSPDGGQVTYTPTLSGGYEVSRAGDVLVVGFEPEPDDLVRLLLSGGGGSAGFDRTGQQLIATGDPRVFRTSEYFVHTPGVDIIVPQFSIEVFHNGKREMQTKTNSPADGDYYVEESGGVGTGFDTVHFISFTPKPTSRLRANYQAA